MSARSLDSLGPRRNVLTCGGCEKARRRTHAKRRADFRATLGKTLLALLALAAPVEAQGNKLGDDAKSEASVEVARPPKPADFSRDFYYKNKLDLSLETGYLPVNIPFAFDFLLGDGYNMTPLKYTLRPNILSLRWQSGNPKGPWILHGNWEWSFSGCYTAITRGPETRYFAYVMGVRRNLVRPRWRIGPYTDFRLGMGDINAKEPKGVVWAQGQDFTFTLNLGSGVRYNISPRYSISAGVNYMHVSNLYLSEPKYPNYGINVYGPLFGVEMRLGKPRLVSQ